MGRPKGSLNDRLWQDALRKVVMERAAGRGSPQKIELAARAVVNAAVDGDIEAAKELGNRLDGRPPQQVRHAGHDGGPLDLTLLGDEDLDMLATRLANMDSIDPKTTH